MVSVSHATYIVECILPTRHSAFLNVVCENLTFGRLNMTEIDVCENLTFGRLNMAEIDILRYCQKVRNSKD